MKNGFVKDVGTLLSGNVIAQLISMAAYLVLTRLYSPEDYGTFTIFYSYIEVLIIISTCKFEMGIVASKNNHDGTALARFALRMNTIVSVLLLGIVSVLYFLGALPGKIQSIGLIALLIPCMVFFMGTSRIYEALYNRHREFKQVAISQLVNATSGSLLKILFGLSRMISTWGLPLGTVLGQMLGNLNYRVRLRRLDFPKVDKAEQRKIAKQNINFALYTAPKDFLNSFSSNLPFIWLALYFDDAKVGLFSLALTFLFRPANIVAGALENVLYVRTAEKVHQNKLVMPDIRRVILSLNAVVLPLCVLAFFVAEPIFVFVFGSQWGGCGFYVRCILPWIYVMLTTNALMFMANIFSKQRIEFLFGIALLLLRVVSIVIGLWQRNFELAIMLFGLVSAGVSLLLGIWYVSLVWNHDKKILNTL